MRGEIRRIIPGIVYLTALLLCCTPVAHGEDPAPDNAAASDEVEPLDTWTPVKEDAGSTDSDGEGKKKSAIRTSNKDPDAELPKSATPHAEGEDGEEVIEIKATVTDPGLKRVDPEALLRQELKPSSTDLTKKEQRRFAEIARLRSEIAREQAAKLGLKKTDNTDPRGDPEVTVCNLNANNYGTKEIWDQTFKRSDIPKRGAMRRSMVRAIKEMRCDLIAVQAILGREDSDATKAAKELVGYKEVDQADWNVVLGRATREVSRNAILYRSAFHLNSTDDFHDSRLSTFGSFKLDKLGLPPIKAEFEVPRKNGDDPRHVTLISYTLKNSVSFNSDESEIKRVQLAEFIRSQTTAIKRSAANEPSVVVLAGNRAGSALSVGTQIIEGRFRMADFQRDGACSFEVAGAIVCENDRIRPKELFGIVGSSAVERIAADIEPIPLPKSAAGAHKSSGPKRPSPVADSLNSEIYVDGEDYYLGLAKPTVLNWFALRIVPVRNGLPQSPFLALKLNW